MASLPFSQAGWSAKAADDYDNDNVDNVDNVDDVDNPDNADDVSNIYKRYINGLLLEIDTQRHFWTSKMISELVHIFLNR